MVSKLRFGVLSHYGVFVVGKSVVELDALCRSGFILYKAYTARV